MRNANTLPTQSHRFTSAKSNQAKLDEDRRDPEFGNLWKRGAEQTSGVYTTTELWNQQGLCWALTSLWPVLWGPGMHDCVGGGSVVRVIGKCGKGICLWTLRCVNPRKKWVLSTQPRATEGCEGHWKCYLWSVGDWAQPNIGTSELFSLKKMFPTHTQWGQSPSYELSCTQSPWKLH